MTRPPLHVHILFHPESSSARALARELLIEWMPALTEPGARVPVYLTPERADGLPPEELDLNAAEHTLVVVLMDRTMANFVDGQGDAWAEWVEGKLRKCPPGAKQSLMPVALDRPGLGLVEAAHCVVAVDLDATRLVAQVSFALSVRALHLLRLGGERPTLERLQGQAPITLFVSHAKKDLSEKRQDPVHFTQAALQALPVREWFDARDIVWGEDFGDAIRAGVERADAVLVFVTDTWSSRPWCITEGLLAKELGTPTLVVDALQFGESRTFPYGGNTRTLRWRPNLRLEDNASEEEREKWKSNCDAEGQRIIAAAVRVTLSHKHARARLESVAEAGDHVLDVAPEPARLAWTDSRGTFLYPDPPVGRDEQRLLKKLLPQADFVTPMTRIARSRQGRPAVAVATSISGSEELAKRGLDPLHERRITDEVHLYLLLAGLKIVYGGRLEPEKLEDPDNFTLRLFSIVRDYAELAKNVRDGSHVEPILNIAPWPLWTTYGTNVTDLFLRRTARLERVGLPEGFPIPMNELEPDDRGFVKPSSSLQVYAWARALTHMRERVTNKAAARLCIGGKIERYQGRLAGLIEEPLLQLRARKPLFLVGALGGATQLVVDLLQGRARAEMTTERARQAVKHYDDVAALYVRHGGEFQTRETVADELHAFGKDGPAAALANGLSDEENADLFETVDPVRIAELVLKGLGRLGL